MGCREQYCGFFTSWEQNSELYRPAFPTRWTPDRLNGRFQEHQLGGMWNNPLILSALFSVYKLWENVIFFPYLLSYSSINLVQGKHRFSASPILCNGNCSSVITDEIICSFLLSSNLPFSKKNQLALSPTSSLYPIHIYMVWFSEDVILDARPEV